MDVLQRKQFKLRMKQGRNQGLFAFIVLAYEHVIWTSRVQSHRVDALQLAVCPALICPSEPSQGLVDHLQRNVMTAGGKESRQHLRIVPDQGAAVRNTQEAYYWPTGALR
jgi:hypothetical protein